MPLLVFGLEAENTGDMVGSVVEKVKPIAAKVSRTGERLEPVGLSIALFEVGQLLKEGERVHPLVKLHRLQVQDKLE